MPDLREQLQSILQGRVCLVGVGNVGYGDDGFGMRLAEVLRDSGGRVLQVRIVSAGCAPERHLNELKDGGFDTVLFLDAVEFGARPGSVALLNSDQMATRFPQVSTHKLSLGLLAQMVEANAQTKVWLLAAQPESLREGSGLSQAVERTLSALRDLLVDSLPGNCRDATETLALA